MNIKSPLEVAALNYYFKMREKERQEQLPLAVEYEGGGADGGGDLSSSQRRKNTKGGLCASLLCC